MKKPIMFAGIAAVVLLVVGYFVVFPMLKGKPAADAADRDEDEPVAAVTKKKPKRKAAEPGLIFPVSERVLNLTSSDGAPHYARIELALEFEVPAGAKVAKGRGSSGGNGEAKETGPALDPLLEPVMARKVQIDDMLVRIIGSKTVGEMTTNEGREALKQEVLTALEEMVVSPEPVGVYIVRLIVQ